MIAAEAADFLREVKKMNVYDNANELVRAMRESHEYKKVKEAAVALGKDENAKKMVDEFFELTQEAEIARYQGKEPDKDTTDKIQRLYGVLSLNSDAMEYLNSYMRFQMMLADITKSIQEVVKEALGEK